MLIWTLTSPSGQPPYRFVGTACFPSLVLGKMTIFDKTESLNPATHCNTLQHIAIHCNTVRNRERSEIHWRRNPLQHTATHCILLHHTATHCNTLQHTAIHCQASASESNTLQHTVTSCNTLQHTAIDSNTLQHTTQRVTAKERGAFITTRVFISEILQHTATHCNTLQHTATLIGAH